MPLTLENIAFQALSFAVLGAFCWMIYTFRAQAAECLKTTLIFTRTSRSKGAATGNRQLYDSFTGVAMTLGALSVGLAAVKFTARSLAAETGTPGTLQWRIADMAGTAGIAGIPSWVAPVTVLAVALVVVGVVLAGVGMLKAAAGITLSGKFVGEIIRTKKNWMATTSMSVIPLVAVWTGVNPVRDRIVAYIIVIVFVTLAALFVAHTFIGFIKQKVSLLVWFLYLCTVEIFPICAVVLAAMKSV